MIRNMDFRLFTLDTFPEDYVKEVIRLASNYEGFAQAYREWCRNYRHRKDLQYRYVVKMEFDDYRYLTDWGETDS
jgi:hypothetical protein